MPIDGIPSAIETFYTKVKPIRRKLRRRLVQWSKATELVIKFTRQSMTATEVCNDLGRQHCPDWTEITCELEAKNLIFKVFEDQLYRSMKKLLMNPEPLGNLPVMATDNL